MHGKLVGGRAKTVCSALELVHLSQCQLGEQVRGHADTLTQVQIVVSTVNTLPLAEEMLRQLISLHTRNQNIGLQAVNL